MYAARMDFGKHDGKVVQDVPTPYLRWCLRDCDCLSPPLRRAIEEELRCRGYDRDRAGADRPRSRAHPPVDFSGILSRWHREMALRFHPDRGGSVEAMTAINVAADRLRQLLQVEAAA